MVALSARKGDLGRGGLDIGEGTEAPVSAVTSDPLPEHHPGKQVRSARVRLPHGRVVFSVVRALFALLPAFASRHPIQEIGLPVSPWRCGGLEDAADYLAIGNDIVDVVFPFAGLARG
jgi:hypothetical protein